MLAAKPEDGKGMPRLSNADRATPGKKMPEIGACDQGIALPKTGYFADLHQAPLSCL
jgi:hypothetical protein